MRIIAIVIFLGCFLGVEAQTDGSIKPLKIEASKTLPDTNANTSLGTKTPSLLDPKPPQSTFSLKKLMKPQVKMLPERDLVDPGRDLKLDPRLGLEGRYTGPSKHYGDMYLGDVKSSGKFVGVVCRDHEYVDGDRVKITANGKVIDHNVLLTAAYKGVNIDLKTGFNRIEFEALNEGQSAPNTAQIDVYDDKGVLIYSNKWNLSEGSKASLIVVKK